MLRQKLQRVVLKEIARRLDAWHRQARLARHNFEKGRLKAASVELRIVNGELPQSFLPSDANDNFETPKKSAIARQAP
ncbi:MAG: hypothetical protein HY243_01935 [Proteobacteria bacterium]|nr:hypothetical protein [Pseudomonadota bacterium]